MINYTEEEITELLNSLDKKGIHPQVSLLMVNSIQVVMEKETIISILKNGPIKGGSYLLARSYANVKNMLHKVPFDMLPLFVNTYPEITAWRLRIGK